MFHVHDFFALMLPWLPADRHQRSQRLRRKRDGGRAAGGWLLGDGGWRTGHAAGRGWIYEHVWRPAPGKCEVCCIRRADTTSSGMASLWAPLAAVNARRSTLADILSVPRSSPCNDASPAPSTPLQPPLEPTLEPTSERSEVAATREGAEGAEVSTSCAGVTTHVESAAEELAGGDEGATEEVHRDGQTAAADTGRDDDGDEEDTPVATKAKPRRPKRRDPCALEDRGEPPTDRADELTWCPVRIWCRLSRVP